MAVERKFPGIIDKPMSFCPGCGHGVISRIICECLEELGQDQNIIFPIGVGCSSNLGAGLTTDRLHLSLIHIYMVKAVVGANWGDEGKGKITDMLAEKADIIVRFQGGANAGHTIVNDYGKFALHTLPSGCLLYTSRCV